LGRLLADIKRRCLHFNKYDLHERWRPLKISLDKRPVNVFFGNGVDKCIRRVPDPQNTHSALLLLEALSIYKQHYGSVFPMPRRYAVDGEDKHLYPPHLHGYKMGDIVANMVARGTWLKDPYRAQFIELGVIPPEREVSLQF